MRRFERRGAGSREVWEIEIVESGYEVRRWVGDHEQTRTQTFSSVTLAIAAARKMIHEKRREGHVELEPPVEAKVARHLRLEAAIRTNPDDPRAWAIYADWLQSEGDPWGERLSLALELERGSVPSDQLERYTFDKLGQLYGPSVVELLDREGFEDVAALTWRHGLVLKVDAPGRGWGPFLPEVVLEALERSPAARLMSVDPEHAARHELSELVFEHLRDRLEVFTHTDAGFYWFMSRGPMTEAEADNLWLAQEGRGELVCEHDYESARSDGFSLFGDCTLRVLAYPGPPSEAAFVAECVYHRFNWFIEQPYCGWRLDVREPPVGGWTELIRDYAHCSADATAEQVFPAGTPGPIERVIAIIDDGNMRLFAIRTPSGWLTFEFETS